jgi:hypothetical protein
MRTEKLVVVSFWEGSVAYVGDAAGPIQFGGQPSAPSHLQALTIDLPPHRMFKRSHVVVNLSSGVRVRCHSRRSPFSREIRPGANLKPFPQLEVVVIAHAVLRPRPPTL